MLQQALIPSENGVPRPESSTMRWKTQAGVVLQLFEMTDGHLCNCINMLRRLAICEWKFVVEPCHAPQHWAILLHSREEVFMAMIREAHWRGVQWLNVTDAKYFGPSAEDLDAAQHLIESIIKRPVATVPLSVSSLYLPQNTDVVATVKSYETEAERLNRINREGMALAFKSPQEILKRFKELEESEDAAPTREDMLLQINNLRVASGLRPIDRNGEEVAFAQPLQHRAIAGHGRVAAPAERSRGVAIP